MLVLSDDRGRRYGGVGNRAPQTPVWTLMTFAGESRVFVVFECLLLWSTGIWVIGLGEALLLFWVVHLDWITGLSELVADNDAWCVHEFVT